MDMRKEQKHIINLYSAFGASLLLTFVPSMMVAGIASVFMLGILIAAYIIRSRSEIGSLEQTHAIYIIRTIYIGSALMLLTIGAASAYMLPLIDHAPIMPCTNMLADQGVAFIQNASKGELIAYLKPCVDNFVTDNKTVFINALVIAAAPVLLYFFYRLAHGLMRVIKGYRIAKPKRWL